MYEPDVTIYKKKYRVIRKRRLKQSVFFYVVKRRAIPFLLGYSNLIRQCSVKGVLREQC